MSTQLSCGTYLQFLQSHLPKWMAFPIGNPHPLLLLDNPSNVKTRIPESLSPRACNLHRRMTQKAMGLDGHILGSICRNVKEGLPVTDSVPINHGLPFAELNTIKRKAAADLEGQSIIVVSP
ncbi:hypothetical protein EV421DRAFT_1732433 [Armillaria borealis]|uniref:Uncharacterized protein n=1 Tax=Armillaria borealis TaxID=47425 RepID=A0AA39MY83_9AGAR|nr:hypothetical protein EV421DRAFT_1732433 [Armillaria borealis]